jgi:recombination protein RecA
MPPYHPSCLREHPEFLEPPENVGVKLDAVANAGAVGSTEWVEEFNRQFGAMLKPSDEVPPITYRSSGSIALDVALGGGWPRGRVIDVIGREGSGKTLLFELAAVAAQKMEGKRSVLFDFEGTFDPKRFVSLGGDPKMLDVVRAENVMDQKAPLLFGETAYDMARIIFMHSNTHACLCFDSTGAMVSKSDYEKREESIEKTGYGVETARLISDGLKLLIGTGMLARSGMTHFYISQSRDNLTQRAIRGIPPPDKPTGGRALRFYASMRVEVSKGDTLKATLEDDTTGVVDTNVEVGHVTKIRVRKNKCNSYQGRVAEFNLFTGGELQGLDRVSELATLAIYSGVAKRGGSWYEVPNIFRVKGKEVFPKAIEDNFAEVEKLVRTRLAEIMDGSSQPETEEEQDVLEDGSGEPQAE